MIIGKRVKFMFAHHEPIVGTVTYLPSATGDSFRIEIDDGMEIWVQQFDYMCVYPEKKS